MGRVSCALALVLKKIAMIDNSLGISGGLCMKVRQFPGFVSRKGAKEAQRRKEQTLLGAFASSLRLCVKPIGPNSTPPVNF